MAELTVQTRPLVSTGGKWWRPIPALIALVLLLPGCASMQPDKTNSAVLEKQIERQQEAHRLKEEEQPREKLSREEYERLGDRYMRGNDPNRGYYYYLKGLEREPDNVPLLHKQGLLLLGKKKYGDAERVYRKLLTLSSKDANAHEGLGRALLGQNKSTEAGQSFKAALAINDGLWQAHHFMGLIYSGQEHYEQAVVEFKRALQIKPRENTVLNNLAVTYCLMGQYEQAEPILHNLAATTKDKKIYNNLALVYVRLQKYDDALNAFKNGAKSESVAYYNMGVEYMAVEMYPEAIDAFEKAIALHPQYYPAAAALLEQAQKKLPKN